MDLVPSPDVAVLLHALLDIFERRNVAPPRGRSETGPEVKAGTRAIRVTLDSLPLPGYHDQTDPAPRQIANDQFRALEQAGAPKLAWLPGESGHLLAAATLVPEGAQAVFDLLQRTPLAARRARLAELLLGERFRFTDWRRRALQHSLDQLKAGKSPAPFSLTAAGDDFNRDLLAALAALDEVDEETRYRVFSVRVFNDSKRFEALSAALVRLARRGRPEWRRLSPEEILRELNLVPNPGHLYLHGPWHLVDDSGQAMSLGEFHPSVGIPAAQAARLRRVTVSAPSVICVENPTSFYELIQHTSGASASLCLWGNPSPACRHLLRCLPGDLPLWVWADIDCGGLNILAQVREQVNRAAAPYRMDVETLEAHAAWARPLAPSDTRNLTRLLGRPSLADMQNLIRHMLARGLKLEQEAVIMAAVDVPLQHR